MYLVKIDMYYAPKIVQEDEHRSSEGSDDDGFTLEKDGENHNS